MVRIYKEQFGRGPTRARTEFAGPDIIVTTLEESLTPAERRLAEIGETSAEVLTWSPTRRRVMGSDTDPQSRGH